MQHQQPAPFTVLFTGGGTGGHVYPGIAVYEALVRKAASIGVPVRGIWVGSGKGMERGIIEPKGIRYVGVPSGKLRRYFSFSNLIDVFKVLAGVAAAFHVMMRYKPQVLFSKGGYVSVPPVIAAKLAGVPVITHESDFDPGLATRINARFASAIILSFEQTGEYFPEKYKPRFLVAGNPVRGDVLAGNAARGRACLAFGDGKPVLLVLGGSQGAREINDLLWRALPELLKGWNIVHQTGADLSGPAGEKNYRRYDYIHAEYGDILAAADLVLCRAGATTLWELAAARKPSLLVPLGRGTSRGDQIRNAGLFERLGASFVLQPGSTQETELLRRAGQFIFEPGLLTKMGEEAAAIFKPDAAEKIAELLLARAPGGVSHEG